jgi:hypothetical protein
LYNRVCRWRLSQMSFTHLPMLYPAWQQVLGQDKQFDSLHWFESARKHYRAEKARLEEGLDTDSNTSGLPGLQIWSQKLASISDADVQNMQLVCLHFLPPHGFVSVYWDLWNHWKVQASKKNCSTGCVCLGISLGWEAVTSWWVGNCRQWSEWQATWWSLSLLTTTSPEPEYSFYEEVNIIKCFVCNFSLTDIRHQVQASTYPTKDVRWVRANPHGYHASVRIQWAEQTLQTFIMDHVHCDKLVTIVLVLQNQMTRTEITWHILNNSLLMMPFTRRSIHQIFLLFELEKSRLLSGIQINLLIWNRIVHTLSRARFVNRGSWFWEGALCWSSPQWYRLLTQWKPDWIHSLDPTWMKFDDTNAVAIHVNENLIVLMDLISWMNVCTICLMTGTLHEWNYVLGWSYYTWKWPYEPN